MIDQLCIGKRYRITLRNHVAAGHLEGVLRSTNLPRGSLGNKDGEHCIWLTGELFEWFLRIGDIAAIQELDEPTEPGLSVAARAACRPGITRFRRAREAADAPQGRNLIAENLICTNELRRQI
jgi:hypothetical protein